MVLRRTIVFKLVIFIHFFLFAENVLSQPNADFSATPVVGCAPLLVQFTDLSTGNPTSWKWDLGNGTTSTVQNPSVAYFTSGQFSIKLIAINSSGSDTIIKNQFIKFIRA
ncbi:MAG: PKD domain-containing protein [Ginsengibacter sp.]